LEGKSFSGKLPFHNCNLKTAASKLTEKKVRWFYSKRNRTSAFSTRLSVGGNEPNPYRKKFNQGATIVPRSVYFVDIAQEIPSDFENRVINVRTSAITREDAKLPWRNIDLKGRIESNFLFRTALSRSILPFTFFDPSLVVLPVIIDVRDDGHKIVTLHSAADLRQKGFLHASRWFVNAERIWEANKTDKAKTMSNVGRLDFQRGLTEQDLNQPYLVLFTKSAKDANAVLCRREALDFEFIADYVTYVFYTREINEAFYLTAILNSEGINSLIKDFQTRGLFGARDVTKKILDVYFPRFDRENPTHSSLANLSEKAHEAANAFIRTSPSSGKITPGKLGRLRGGIKDHLKAEMKEIDDLVVKIIK